MPNSISLHSKCSGVDAYKYIPQLEVVNAAARDFSTSWNASVTAAEDDGVDLRSKWEVSHVCEELLWIDALAMWTPGGERNSGCRAVGSKRNTLAKLVVESRGWKAGSYLRTVFAIFGAERPVLGHTQPHLALAKYLL